MWQQKHSLSIFIGFQDWHQFMPFVTMPLAPTPQPFTKRIFLDFCAIFCPSGPSFFCQHDSPGNLAVPSRCEQNRLGGRVPGLPIRDCARGCNNRAQMCAQLSPIDVTAKTFFERLYLVLGLGTFGLWVNCPYAPTTPPIHLTTISRFLSNSFSRMAPPFFKVLETSCFSSESMWNQRTQIWRLQ